MIYVAYGSNMSKARMVERCPNAKFLTAGIVEHYTIQFHHYADAVRAHDYDLPVVVWSISDEEMQSLERDEGYPKHYEKQELLVYPTPSLSIDEMRALVGAKNVADSTFYSNQGIVGIAFVMTEWKRTKWEQHSEKPREDYVAHIRSGYGENNFTGRYLQDLELALERGESRPESRS